MNKSQLWSSLLPAYDHKRSSAEALSETQNADLLYKQGKWSQ